MRIESIKIHNFRQYRDAEILFDRKDDSPDLHIILGNNGTGKTNVLNAITWCVYGEEFHLGDKNSAQDRINSCAVVDCRRRGDTHCDVKVTISISTGEDQNLVEFTRVEKYSITECDSFSYSEKFCVGTYNPNKEWIIIDNEEETQLYVSKYLPETINEYIFFDGEHLEHYFKDRNNVQVGIKELSQANLLDKAINGYRSYIKNQIEPLLVNGTDLQISEKQREVQIKEKDIEGQKEVVSRSQKELNTCEINIQQCVEIIKGHESAKEKTDKLVELEKRIEEIDKSISDKKTEIMLFIREQYVLFTFYPLIKKYYDYIKSEESAGKLPPKIDRSLLEQCMSDKKCAVCGSSLDGTAQSKVLALLQKLSMASETSAELNKTMTALQGYIEQMKNYKSRKDNLLASLCALQEESKKANEAAQSIRKFLQGIPNNEEICRAIEDRDKWTKQKDDLLKKIGKEEGLLSNQESQLSLLKKDLQKLMEQNSNFRHLSQKKLFCEKCSTILAETRDEILAESREKMKIETLEQYKNLMWKKDMFTNVEIEQDYSMKLIDMYGNQALGSCSSGELVLLALSFTLSLQDTTKHDSLLFIDTPIGRVDPDNRINFMNVLLKVSSNKQVILTFTPSEYDSEVASILAGHYSSFIKLYSTDGVTTINKK
ncbi:MAG: AAA family ATPase [Bacteroidales bacterium]|nr:AAA family ATPase [Bacteroidales bacterium]